MTDLEFRSEDIPEWWRRPPLGREQAAAGDLPGAHGDNLGPPLDAHGCDVPCDPRVVFSQELTERGSGKPGFFFCQRCSG